MKKNNQNLPLNLLEKNRSRVSMICALMVLIMVCMVLAIINYNLFTKPETIAREDAAAEEKRIEEELENAPEITEIHVAAVGDNLLHTSLISSGHGETDTGQWNYDHLYANVKSQISAADVAIVSQETAFVTSHDEVSGSYPFGTPQEVGDALINAGFDVIGSSSDHIDDFGLSYITSTLNFWNTKYPNIPVVGIHDTEADASAVKTLDVNGIRISFLDYTFGTSNSDYYEEDYVVDVLDKTKVADMVTRARQESDVLIFMVHWGSEGETMPTEYEKQWANYLMSLGVDVILGSFPHVLQPYGWLSDEAGHRTLIYYSLGNFTSGYENLTQLLSGMACFTIEKRVQSGITSFSIKDESLEPMVMHYDVTGGNYSVYMLSDYTDALASSHTVNEYMGGNVMTTANLWAKYNEIVSMNVEPSTGTDYLTSVYSSGGSFTDSLTGNVIDDTASITSVQYYSALSDGTAAMANATLTQADGTSADGSPADTSSADGYDTSYDTGYDTSYDTSYDTGYDTSYDTSYDTGYDTSYDTGYDTSYDTDYYDESYYDQG